MTAAPFLEGMYQPTSRRPSLVVKATSSYSVPRFGVGTKARPVWVMTYDWASGKTTK